MAFLISAAEQYILLSISSNQTMRVFPLGVHPDRGWAARMHLTALVDYASTALSTEHFGVAQTAGQAFDMARGGYCPAHDLQHHTHLSLTFDGVLLRQRIIHANGQLASAGTSQTSL